MQNNDHARSLIAEICCAESPGEAFNRFCALQSQLPDCKIILPSEHGGSAPGFAVHRDFPNGAAVRGLFRSPRVLVLDKATVADMLRGTATYSIDFSISLDTQAISYLEPFLLGKHTAADFLEVFAFISRNDVNVDPLPYQTENIQNLADPYAAQRIFEKIRAYEVLRTLDVCAFEKHGLARTRLSESELLRRAQCSIARMYANAEDPVFMRSIQSRHQLVYAYLLKMTQLQLSHPRRSRWHKLQSFLHFSDSQLATISERETFIANTYFKQGQHLRFFGKIQIGNEHIFDELKNMAWDCWHIRSMEQMMTFKPELGARYMFPALLTFDRRLIELLDLYPLRAFAFLEAERMPMSFYENDWLTSLAPEPEQRDTLQNDFFQPHCIVARQSRRRTVDWKTVISTLEAELSETAGVHRQPSG